MGGCVCCSPPYPQKAHVLLIDELPAGPFGYATVIRIYIAHYIREELGLLPISLVLCCVLCLLPCFKHTTEVRAKGSLTSGLLPAVSAEGRGLSHGVEQRPF